MKKPVSVHSSANCSSLQHIPSSGTAGDIKAIHDHELGITTTADLTSQKADNAPNTESIVGDTEPGIKSAAHLEKGYSITNDPTAMIFGSTVPNAESFIHDHSMHKAAKDRIKAILGIDPLQSKVDSIIHNTYLALPHDGLSKGEPTACANPSIDTSVKGFSNVDSLADEMQLMKIQLKELKYTLSRLESNVKTIDDSVRQAPLRHTSLPVSEFDNLGVTEDSSMATAPKRLRIPFKVTANKIVSATEDDKSLASLDSLEIQKHGTSCKEEKSLLLTPYIKYLLHDSHNYKTSADSSMYAIKNCCGTDLVCIMDLLRRLGGKDDAIIDLFDSELFARVSRFLDNMPAIYRFLDAYVHDVVRYEGPSISKLDGETDQPSLSSGARPEYQSRSANEPFYLPFSYTGYLSLRVAYNHCLIHHSLLRMFFAERTIIIGFMRYRFKPIALLLTTTVSVPDAAEICDTMSNNTRIGELFATKRCIDTFLESFKTYNSRLLENELLMFYKFYLQKRLSYESILDIYDESDPINTFTKAEYEKYTVAVIDLINSNLNVDVMGTLVRTAEDLSSGIYIVIKGLLSVNHSIASATNVPDYSR